MIRKKSGKEALQEMLDGNLRYVNQGQLHPRQGKAERQNAIENQIPFAALLSCSDSRVPAEIIFDQGLSDLFIVRTAGHVINDLVIGSLEFAVHVLNVPLIMVMGHTKCGAVEATIQNQSLPGFISSIAASIQPAVASVPNDGDMLTNATYANTSYVVSQLTQKSVILAKALDNDQLMIVPAYFDLRTSKVRILEEK